MVNSYDKRTPCDCSKPESSEHVHEWRPSTRHCIVCGKSDTQPALGLEEAVKEIAKVLVPVLITESKGWGAKSDEVRTRRAAQRQECESAIAKGLSPLLAARDAELAALREALVELVCLYDWRFELAEEEKSLPLRDQMGYDSAKGAVVKAKLRQYGEEKKLAWEKARAALGRKP